jgi:hypothetical protein
MHLLEQWRLWVLVYTNDQCEFNVIFNHAENAIEAKPVKGIPAASENEFYSVTMRFTELSDAN